MSATAHAVPDAVAPPARNPRFPLIDGMRAVAALSVLVVHVAFFSEAIGDSLGGRLLAHLNVGVTIFFVISGFLLYRPFVLSRTPGGPRRAPVPLYFWRRFLRIYPAYWLLLVVLTLAPGVAAIAGGDWFNQFAMLQTLPIGTGSEATCVQSVLVCGAAQTWSLAVELTFYVALPAYALLVAAAARRVRPGLQLPAELLLLITLSAVSTITMFTGGEGTSAWISGTAAGYALWFALGMVLALISVEVEAEARRGMAFVRLIRRAPLLPWAAALIVYVAFSLMAPPTPFLLVESDRLAGHLVFAAIAFLVMLPAVFCDNRSDGAPTRLLCSPVAAWLGLISYGIFLWHYAIAQLWGDELSFVPLLVVTLVATIACAAASYYLLERPLLRLKNPSSRWTLGRRLLPREGSNVG